MDVVETSFDTSDETRLDYEEILIDDEEILKLYPFSSCRNKFIYDITLKKVIKNCELMPTDIAGKGKFIFGANNKYPVEEINVEEEGKWLIFPRPVHINLIWEKIKQGIINGRLWKAYVSSDANVDGFHLVMIYTKQFTDVDDVIATLDYIESTGIKPSEISVIRYKTEMQTLDGVYSLFGQKSTIYHSDTIRNGISYNCNTEGYWSYSHLNSYGPILNCTMKPTEVLRADSKFLFARNDAYGRVGLFYHDGEELNRKKFGKWMIKTSEARVNAIWDTVKDSITKGYFWFAEVSTKTPTNPKYYILIFNADYTDTDEIVSILDNIEALGIANLKYYNITYESLMREHNSCGTEGQHLVRYSSRNIRTLAMDVNNRNAKKDGYSFIYDIHAKEIISSGFLKPSEVLSKEYRHMFSKNNKYNENNLDYTKVGCWKLHLPTSIVDKLWDSVKEETEKGNLWYSKLTDLQCEEEIGLFVYTKDAHDVEDVIKVLNLMEITGIKPKNSSVLNYYISKAISLLEPRLDENTKSPLYSSDNIRLLPYDRTVNSKPTSSNNDNWRSRPNNTNNDRREEKSTVLSWRLRN